jgi:hypothetical protein
MPAEGPVTPVGPRAGLVDASPRANAGHVPGRNRPEQLVAGTFVDAGTTSA